MRMVTVGIQRCPAELWARCPPGRDWTVGEIVSHAVWSLATYTQLGERALVGMQCLSEGGATKEAVVAALEQVLGFVQEGVLPLSDEELLGHGVDDGSMCVKHLMYARRHTQHHVGEFVQILTENSVEPPAWSFANRQ